MIEDIGFGDVFEYQGDQYVYFAESVEDGIVFAGKILDIDDSRQLQKMAGIAAKKGTNQSDADIYSYVVLQTADFKQRAVLCAIHDSSVQLGSPRQTLDSEDLDSIRKEIADRPGLSKLKQILELLS